MTLPQSPLIGAVAVFIIGRWLISMVTRLVGAAMTRQRVDPTVQRYLVSFIVVALNITLVVAILGYFGVETTSFAALVAGAGVAVRTEPRRAQRNTISTRRFFARPASLVLLETGA